jgi:hypothetical protein
MPVAPPVRGGARTLSSGAINPGPFHTTTLANRSEGVAYGDGAPDPQVELVIGQRNHAQRVIRGGRGTVATAALSHYAKRTNV